MLAAGLGRRFGGAKLSAVLAGRPLVAHVLGTARAAAQAGYLDPIMVVCGTGPRAGSDASLIRALAIEGGFIVADNDDPPAGLARSLGIGLTNIESSRAAAALVFLADQPTTRLDVVGALVERWRAAPVPILAPRYRSGGRGNPVIVARELWPLARTLRGDRGLSALFGSRPGLVTDLDVEGSNPDIDRPAELEALGALEASPHRRGS